MKSEVILTLKDACSGTIFRYSGQKRPDTYLFHRVPGKGHLHQLVVSLEEWRKIKADILQQPLPIPIDIDFSVECEAGDADQSILADVQGQIEEMQKQRKLNEEERDTLRREKTELEAVAANAGGGGLTDDQKAFLDERDAMLEVLGPLAKETESPLQCLERVTEEFAKKKGKSKLP